MRSARFEHDNTCSPFAQEERVRSQRMTTHTYAHRRFAVSHKNECRPPHVLQFPMATANECEPSVSIGYQTEPPPIRQWSQQMNGRVTHSKAPILAATAAPSSSVTGCCPCFFSSAIVAASFRRSLLQPTSTNGTPGQKCRTSGTHCARQVQKCDQGGERRVI
jgi:hypothetical protein